MGSILAYMRPFLCAFFGARILGIFPSWLRFWTVLLQFGQFEPQAVTFRYFAKLKIQHGCTCVAT